MAIATFTIDLNGGDVETSDNALYFKIYGSADSYATPIATTGTDLADTDVFTTGGVATITNVDIGTETSFKVGVVDGDANESNLSAIYTISGQDPGELYSAPSAATYAGTENDQATGFTNTNACVISVVNIDPGYGTYSVKLIPSATTTYIRAEVVNIPTTSGKTYRVKARMKVVGTLPEAQLWLSGANGWVSGTSAGVATNSWADYSIDLESNVTQSNSKISFYVNFGTVWDGTSYLLVDKLSVIELP